MKRLIVSLLLVCTGLVVAQERVGIAIGGNYTVEEGLQLIKNWESIPGSEFERGVVYTNIIDPKNDLDGIERSLELFEIEYERTSSAISMAYIGIGIALKSSYQIANGDFMASLSNLELSIKKINEAVELDKKSIDIRFIRVASYLEITESSPMDLGDEIEGDIKYLKSVKSRMTEEDKVAFYYYSGRNFLRQNKIDLGITYLEKVVKLGLNSRYKKLSKELLLKWEE